MQKLRVGVLMGGKSIEREVSFNSGRTVCDHLDSSRYEIIPLFQHTNGMLYSLPWRFLHRGKISDFIAQLVNTQEIIPWDHLSDIVDFVYICTHGRYAEDGALQATLTLFDIPYLGSKIYASAISMDKIIQKDILRMHNIAVPTDVTVYPQQINNWKQSEQHIITQMNSQNISFPCIVKPHKEGSSLGVFMVQSQDELYQKMYDASWINGHTQQAVLIEEKLDGFEFSCIPIFDYKNNRFLPMPPTEIVPEDGTDIFDYEQKYMPGRAHKFTPARTSQEIIERIQAASVATAQVLEMRTIARIDGFVTTDNKIVIVDPNTLSGMAPSSFLFREAAEIGMSHTDLINHLIEAELHAYGMLDTIIEQEKKMEHHHTTKKRVAVLLGGRSHEKEISLESGRNIIYKLSPHTYEIMPLFVNKDLQLYRISQSILVRNSTTEIEMALTSDMHITWNELPQVADFVFIGLHGGEGENGTVQGMLETLGMPYNGSSVLASSICMNKYRANRLLNTKGFDVPAGILVEKKEWQNDHTKVISDIIKQIPLPVIVKPHNDGCSVMVQKAHTEKELETAVTNLFSHGKEHGLVEECITGMELTVGVIGNESPQALPPSNAISTQEILSIQEKFLPGAGENQTPAPLPDAAQALVKKTMEEVYQAVSCSGYARIDCFYQSAKESPTSKERVIIIEINTLPGMTPATCIFHQAAEVGLKPMGFIDTIVKLGIEKHTPEKKESPTKTSLTMDLAG